MFYTKNRVVVTDDYGPVRLAAYETPTPYFGDIGESKLDETGEAWIYIDPIFCETIENGVYQVFCQRYGEGELYVAERTPAYFVVRGTPGLAFGWEMKAPQKGFSNNRFDSPNYGKNMAERDIDGPDIDDPEYGHDYGEDAAEYIKR